MSSSDFEKSKEKLTQDYRKLLKDAEDLISSLPGELNDKTSEAKARLEETVGQFKNSYGSAADRVQEQIKKSDQLIRDYPYQAAGISLAIGFLIGLLLKRGNS